jgi:hypothetical protein
VPNLTAEEVIDMFRQYQAESGQIIEDEVVSRVHEVTRGQPGLVGWFGELLTEKYNPRPPAPITLGTWTEVYAAACQVEPNNTVLNLLKKAGQYRSEVAQLFTRSDIPFSFGQPWCSYLYMNGVIDYEKTAGGDGLPLYVCRFSSPFLQLRLYSDLLRELSGEETIDGVVVTTVAISAV